MIPWEKELYVRMLLQYLEDEKLKMQQQITERKSQRQNRSRR
jgi:hypothetical protein